MKVKVELHVGVKPPSKIPTLRPVGGSVTFSLGLTVRSHWSGDWGRSQLSVTVCVFVCKAFPDAAYPSVGPLSKLSSVVCCLCSFLPLDVMKKHLTACVWRDCTVICLVLLGAPGRAIQLKEMVAIRYSSQNFSQK